MITAQHRETLAALAQNPTMFFAGTSAARRIAEAARAALTEIDEAAFRLSLAHDEWRNEVHAIQQTISRDDTQNQLAIADSAAVRAVLQVGHACTPEELAGMIRELMEKAAVHVHGGA